MDDDPDLEGTRPARWLGLTSLTIFRLWKRATRGGSGRVLTTVAAVAVTIALLLVVTGIAVGLADGGLASESDADVVVTPDSATTLSTVDGVEEPRLGATSDRAESLRAEDGVDHASPVLLETARLEAEGGEERTVLFVGIDPDGESRTVAGLPTDGLADGDDGDGNGTADAVLSRTAADDLGVTTGEDVAVSSARTGPQVDEPTLSVSAVETVRTDSEETGPVVLVHVEDLREIADSEDRDLANHLLLWGDPDRAEGAAAGTYPDATVEQVGGTNPSSLFGDGLAFATSLLALVIGVVISASFVATTMGMTVDEDRKSLAVLAAVGFPTRSRLAIVALSTALTTLAGALVGIGLGVLAIVTVNTLAIATVAPGAVAVVHPLFVPYALAVSLLAGLVATPSPLAIATRTTVLEEVAR